jgi:hypothetical protein
MGAPLGVDAGLLVALAVTPRPARRRHSLAPALPTGQFAGGRRELRCRR